MSDDWKAGDLAVCVDATSPPHCAPPDDITTACMAFLVRGRAYRVSCVSSEFGRLWLNLDGAPVSGAAYAAERFRKLNDGEDDAELIQRIKSCRPAKVNHPA